MSLLLDALHRASKDKEKAAALAANAAAAESLSEGRFTLAAPAVPAAAFPDLIPPVAVAPSPVAETPMELTPDVPMVFAKPEVLELEMELEPSTPAVVVSVPEGSVEKPPLADSAPVKNASLAPESTAPAPVAPSFAKRLDISPKSTNTQAAAAAIQNAYAAPAFTARRSTNRRAIVLAGIAGLLGLAFASFVLGLWGDLDKLLGLGQVSSVAPSAALSSAPVAVAPLAVVAVPEVKVTSPATAIAPSTPPALVGGSVIQHSQGSTLVTRPTASTASMAPPVAPGVKRPPKTDANEPILRSAPVAPVFAVRARNQSALEVGYAALQARRFDDASRAYAAALEANPGEPDALLGMAYIAHTRGQRDEAQNYYRRVLRQDPGNGVANAGLVALDAGTNGSGNAASQGERVKELAARQPDSAAVQALAASVLVQDGTLPDAALAFARAQALEPGNPLHAYNLAVALDRLGNYVQATTQYDKALRVSDAAAVPLGAPQTNAARARSAQLRQSLNLPREAAP